MLSFLWILNCKFHAFEQYLYSNVAIKIVQTVTIYSLNKICHNGITSSCVTSDGILKHRNFVSNSQNNQDWMMKTKLPLGTLLWTLLNTLINSFVVSNILPFRRVVTNILFIRCYMFNVYVFKKNI